MKLLLLLTLVANLIYAQEYNYTFEGEHYINTSNNDENGCVIATSKDDKLNFRVFDNKLKLEWEASINSLTYEDEDLTLHLNKERNGIYFYLRGLDGHNFFYTNSNNKIIEKKFDFENNKIVYSYVSDNNFNFLTRRNANNDFNDTISTYTLYTLNSELETIHKHDFTAPNLKDNSYGEKWKIGHDKDGIIFHNLTFLDKSENNKKKNHIIILEHGYINSEFKFIKNKSVIFNHKISKVGSFSDAPKTNYAYNSQKERFYFFYINELGQGFHVTSLNSKGETEWDKEFQFKGDQKDKVHKYYYKTLNGTCIGIQMAAKTKFGGNQTFFISPDDGQLLSTYQVDHKDRTGIIGLYAFTQNAGTLKDVMVKEIQSYQSTKQVKDAKYYISPNNESNLLILTLGEEIKVLMFNK